MQGSTCNVVLIASLFRCRTDWLSSVHDSFLQGAAERTIWAAANEDPNSERYVNTYLHFKLVSSLCVGHFAYV